MSKWLDKVLLLVAIVIAGAAAYYAASNSYQSNVRQSGMRGNTFDAELPSIESPPQMHWDEPAKQQDNWIFEVFTPPRVFFNQGTSRFVIQLPDGEVPPPPATEFGLEVVGIKREPFRVQLTGYSGPVGYFRISGQNERGRAKQVFEEARVEVISVDEERIVESDPDAPKQTPRIRRQGVAVVKDLDDGKEYRLVNGVITNNAFPMVEVQMRTQESRDVQAKEMKAGEVWEVNGIKYTLVSVDEENKNAVVKREPLDGSTPEEVKTLNVEERIVLEPVYSQEYRDAPAPLPTPQTQQRGHQPYQEEQPIEGTLSRPPPPGEGMNVPVQNYFE